MVEGDLFQASGAKDKVDMKSFVSECFRYWYLFVFAVGVCLAAAFFKIRYTVPKYDVGGTVLIKDRREGSGVTAIPLGELEMFGTSKSIDDEIIVLKSQSLMERVLRELALNTTYYIDGRVLDMEVYPGDLPVKLIIKELFPSAYGKTIVIYPENDNSFRLGEVGDQGEVGLVKYSFGQQIEKPYGTFTVIAAGGVDAPKMREKLIIVFHNIEDMAGQYADKLTVTPVNKSANVLSLSIIDPVWQKGVDILNKLLEVYEQEAIEDKNRLASSTLDFIDERLRYLTEELTDVEKNVALYKMQNDLTDVSSEAQLYLKSANDYNKQLAEFEIQIDLLESIEEYLARDSEEVLVPSSMNIQDPTLLLLISKFNELQLERQRMLRTTQPDNPLIHNLNEQLGNLRQNIVVNVRNIKSGLVITRDNLISSSQKFAYRIRKVPAMERQLLEINRQQGVKEGLYLYLLQKREEAALSLAASVSNFRIVDAPRVIAPIRANKPLTYLVALSLGLTFPISFIYLSMMFNTKIRSVGDIEHATATPVLGEVARYRGQELLAITREASSPIIEMFRLIRSNLQFATLGKPNQVILVTSTMSGEGKSFFSLNLGASLAMTGKRVVVVGMDLRKPELAKGMPRSPSLGVTNFLISDSTSVDELVSSFDAVPGLHIIRPGPVMPCPTELMMSPKVGVLLDTLRSSFDHIIVDSAPIGIVADAFALAPYLDSTIYLVRCNYTPCDGLSIIDKIFREKKLRYPMIVLNYVRLQGKKYGYYYGKRKKENPVRQKTEALNRAATVVVK